MIDLAQALELLSQGSVVLGALLAIIGGLKVLARYTKSDADDRFLAMLEKPLVVLRDLLSRKSNDKGESQ